MKTRKPEYLTPEKLRTYKGLKNVTDVEAEKIIETIRTFARITFKRFREHLEDTEKDKKS
jgi:hypothetical protein